MIQRDESGTFVFQNAIDIAAPSAAIALRAMADAGAALSRVCLPPAAGPDANLLEDRLPRWNRAHAQLNIQIVARTTPIPWDPLAWAACGIRMFDSGHVPRHAPCRRADSAAAALSIADCTIPSDKPLLAVSLNSILVSTPSSACRSSGCRSWTGLRRRSTAVGYALHP